MPNTSGVFLDFRTVSTGDLDTGRLEHALPGIVYHDVTSSDVLRERLYGMEIVLTNKIGISAEEMDAAGQMRLICLAATGTNNVDLDAAHERGIAVCNIRGYCSDSVVQHVFALMLALNQSLFGYQELLRDGVWRDAPQFCLLDYSIAEVRGQVLGIVGYGEIGRAVARLGEAFGMDVRVANRPGTERQAGRVPLQELLPEVDVLSLHCPLTGATTGLIGADEFAAMKPTSILINTARGAIVDETALVAALRNRSIGAAGIDVLSEEPPVSGNPLLESDVPNLIVTPHIAWAALEARQAALDEIAANIEAFMSGGDRNRVV